MENVTAQGEHFTVTPVQLHWFLCYLEVQVQTSGTKQGAIQH